MATTTTRTRYLVRCVLVCMIAAVSCLLVLNWRRSRPDYIWQQAQRESAEKRYPQAAVYLHRLLQKDPDNVDAHLLLADVLIQGAEQDPSAAATARRTATGLIVHATKLAPENLVAQQTLLRVVLDWGGDDHDLAVSAATAVAKLDPDNAAANYVLARQAVESRQFSHALELLERLRRHEQPVALRTLLLMARATHGLQPTSPTNESIDEAFAACDRLQPAELAAVTSAVRRDLNWLFSVGVDSAPTYELALDRLAILVDLLDRQATAGSQASSTERSRLVDSAARMYGSMLPHLTAPTADETLRARRRAVDARVAALCRRAIQANVARPAVYWALARSEFLAGNGSAAFQLIDQGLTRAATAPEVSPDDVLWLHQLAGIERMRAGQIQLTKPHAEALLRGSNQRLQGWGHLLAGRLALVESRQAEARSHIEQAQRLLGDMYTVNAALVEINLRQSQLEAALPYLERMHSQLHDALAEDPNHASAGTLASGPAIHLTHAWTLITLGRWDEAESHLTACEMDRALAPRAHELRLRHAFGTGQRAAALARLEQARQEFPDDFGLVLLQSTFLRVLNRSNDADRVLSDFTAAHPSDLEALYHLVNLRLREGHRAEVEAMLRKEEDQSADFPTAQIVRAQLHLVDGQWEQVRALASEIDKLPGGRAIGLVLHTLVALQMDDTEEASRLFAQMNAEGNYGSAFGFVRSFAEMGAGDDAQMILKLGNLLSVSSMRPLAQQLMDGALVQLAREAGLAAAESSLNKLLAKNPVDPYLLAHRWNLAVQLRNFALAHETLDRLESLQPHLQQLSACRRSQTLLAEGRIGEALATIEKLIPGSRPLSEAKTEDLVLLLQGAEVSLANAQYQQAIDYAAATLRLDERCWRAYLTLGAAQFGAAQFDAALDSLRTFIRAQPDRSEGYQLLASLLANHPDRKIDDAVAVLADGRKRLPGDPSLALLQIGLLPEIDRLNEAQQVARELAEHDASPGIKLAVAQVFVNAGALDTAAEWVQLAKSSNAGEATCETMLGQIRMTQGLAKQDQARLTEASQHFANVIAVEPQNLIAANNLALLLGTTFGQPEKALEVLDRATAGIPRESLRAEVIDTYARVLRNLDRIDEARQLVDKALELDPQQAVLRYQQGLILQQTGRSDEARAALQAALNLGLPTQDRAAAEQALKALEQDAQ